MKKTKATIKIPTLFELSWTWYEDYRPILFFHASKTRSEFEADVKRLFRECGPDYLKKETSWVGAPGWIEYVAKKLSGLGYIEAIPESLDIFGAYIIKGTEKDFGKLVGKNLLKAAAEHNKIVEKRVKRHLNKRKSRENKS